MASYDFKSLSSYDFELLVRDLLQKELSTTLESFKGGRDKGIDLRYSRPESGNTIVQCKHYAESGFSKLAQHLRDSERSKVLKLKPDRYILATSVPLTVTSKTIVKAIFKPYLKSTADVLGREDLNNLLGTFPTVEQQHFKLWLTSVPVMERILKSRVFNQSDIAIDNIKRKLRFYVQNESFQYAQDILKDTHYCIISGIPGIGKTTLAEMLMVHYLSREFEVYSITDNISEAIELYKPGLRQAFFYDDFLGQTSLDGKLGKNEDSNLLSFIDTVSKSNTHRFVLTTREYILNQAKTTYEKLSQSKFDYNKCVIDLSQYTLFDRAKILFNHVYFSDLPQQYKDALLAKRAYMGIVRHANVSPRIIEWMSSYTRVSDIPSKNYVRDFIANLDDPSKLWEHAFENQ